MLKIIEGQLQGKGKKVALIVSRFNSFIVDKLLEGALDALLRHGVEKKDIVVYKLPGAFEFSGFLPYFLKKNSSSFDGMVCLGAIIRGETPHFDYVAAETTKSIAHVAMESPIPLGFGILTVDHLEQAVNRAGAKSGNKGFEAAVALIEMMDLYQQL